MNDAVSYYMRYTESTLLKFKGNSVAVVFIREDTQNGKIVSARTTDELLVTEDDYVDDQNETHSFKTPTKLGRELMPILQIFIANDNFAGMTPQEFINKVGYADGPQVSTY